MVIFVMMVIKKGTISFCPPVNGAIGVVVSEMNLGIYVPRLFDRMPV